MMHITCEIHFLNLLFSLKIVRKMKIYTEIVYTINSNDWFTLTKLGK